MNPREIYDTLCQKMIGIYDAREGATIARYLIEDIYGFQFWDEYSYIDPSSLDQIIQRLQLHEPWQYIGGIADFYGLKFKVNPSVLIPRPETEELVFNAINLINKYNLTSVLDIGTGSGNIPITLVKKSKIKDVYGLDISDDALQVAHENGSKHGAKVLWMEQDIMDQRLWYKLPKVDLVISNPPYITDSEKSKMEANVLQYEPWMALFVQDEPLEFYRKIADFVVSMQGNNTWLMVEINENYGDAVCQLFIQKGFSDVKLIIDLQGKHRIVQAFY
jgi:release factor glutamine methyltransferase